MKRVYHRYEHWECYKNRMYQVSDIEEEKNIEKVIDFFSDENMFLDSGKEMVFKWKITLEHHLSDPSINKIAFIGQASCNFKYGIPEITTKKAWKLIDESIRTKSNKNALKIIKHYFENETKNKQLYLILE